METASESTKFDRDVMWEAVRRLYPKARTPDDPGDVTTEQMANALRRFFEKFANEHGRDKLLKCDNCREVSPEGEEKCPFCGDAEKEDDENDDEKVEAKTMETGQQELGIGDGSGNGTAKSRRRKTANGSVPATEAAKPAAKKAAKPAAKKAAKPAAKKAAKPAKKAPAKKAAKPVAKKADAIPVLSEGQRAKLRESLDGSVKNIRDLQRDMLRNGYDLGKELTKVFESESWKARGKFKSFKEWCLLEAGFTAVMARNYMGAARDFDRDQYAKLGVTKLAAIASLPPDQRKPVLKLAEEGASLRDIQAKVIKVKEHIRGKADGGKPSPTSAKISAVVKLTAEPVELLLFAKDPDKEGKPIPINSYEKGAWTYLDLGGGVWMRVDFVASASGSVQRLKVKFSRKTQD